MILIIVQKKLTNRIIGMENRLKIKELLYKCIELNIEDPQGFNESMRNESYLLLAEGASIDSLQLVNIIVDFEAELSDFFGRSISLTSDDAISRSDSPFYNVKTLCEYVLLFV